MVKINLLELFQYLDSNKLPALQDTTGRYGFDENDFRKALELFRLKHPKEPEINLVPKVFKGVGEEEPELITQMTSGNIQVYYKDGAWYSPTLLDLPDFHFFKNHHTLDHDEKLRFGGRLERFKGCERFKPIDGVYFLYNNEGKDINIYQDEQGFYTTRHQIVNVNTLTIMRLMADAELDLLKRPIKLKPLEVKRDVMRDCISLLEEAGSIVNEDLYKRIESIIAQLIETGLVKTFYLFQVGHRYSPKHRLFVNIPSMPNYSFSHNNAYNIIEVINHTTNESLRLLRHGEVKTFDSPIGKGLPDPHPIRG